MFTKLIEHLKDAFYFPLVKKKGILVYVGLHKGASFNNIFRRYERCYGFEANPELCLELQERFKKYLKVRIIHATLTDKDGEVDFHVSSNDGASSSVGQFKEKWEEISPQTRMIKTIRVPAINLFNFLLQQKINSIDTYISDIQGLDLSVLKTLRPLIETGRIGEITCEVTKDQYSNLYKNLPDNSESEFDKLLNQNYECVARGWGTLEDGSFSGVPEEWWEFDCKWRVKK